MLPTLQQIIEKSGIHPNTNRIVSLLRADIVPYKLKFIDTNDSIFIHK